MASRRYLNSASLPAHSAEILCTSSKRSSARKILRALTIVRRTSTGSTSGLMFPLNSANSSLRSFEIGNPLHFIKKIFRAENPQGFDDRTKNLNRFNIRLDVPFEFRELLVEKL